MRVMLDTNVIISVIIFNSKSLKTLLEIIVDKYKLVLSSYVIFELKEVIKRKFDNKELELNKFLDSLPFEMYYTSENIIENNFTKIRDIKDAPVLYSAIMADVDILITGDKDFEDLDIIKPQIMTPAEFLDNYM